jgi:ferrous iron transport protein A
MATQPLPVCSQGSAISTIHPLAELRPAQRAVIQELQGGYSFRSRLAALGFVPGTVVRMLRNLGHGPVIVNVRDTRIALGREEAQKVLVQAEKEGRGNDGD